MNYNNIQPGELVIARIRAYQEDKGPIYDIIYGIAIDQHENKVDIHMPYSYPLYSKHFAACTTKGKFQDTKVKNLTPWAANSHYIMSVFLEDIIRSYNIGTTPLKVSIKTYLRQIFAPYTPRYVGQSDVKYQADIYSLLKPVVIQKDNQYILTEQTIHINPEINPVPEGYLYLSKSFIAYTKPHVVRKNLDPYPNKLIKIDKDNFKPLDFKIYKDGLPYDNIDKWDLVLPIDTLLFGIIKQNNNEYYFSEWFIGTQQLLMFMIILFNDSKIVTDKKGAILSDKDVIKRLTLPNCKVKATNTNYDIVADKWQRSYMSYQHHMPEYLLAFLYCCMKYERPEQAWYAYQNIFTVDEKELFKNLFKFIQVK